MENQPTNESQEMPIKLIMIPQLINMMKMDHQPHDNKKKYNAVIDKGLFKSTN
jgi:hypothetical protein